jgi:raffinose/stachyose/melibiose transport system permease protein
MANIAGLPGQLFFGNYRELLTSSDLRFYFLNSIRSTFLSLVFILLFGFVVGYFLSRFRFRGNRLIFALFMAGLLMPIHALIVPMYIQFKQFDLQNKWFTLILPYVTFGMPIAVFLVESYLKSIPQEWRRRRPSTARALRARSLKSCCPSPCRAHDDRHHPVLLLLERNSSSR